MFDDGQSAVVTVDPASRVIAVRPVRFADFFKIVFVVNQTLVTSVQDSTVRAVPLDGGRVRLLGSGNPVAGTRAGTVWITGEPPEERLVDDVGRVLRQMPGPPHERGDPCVNCPGVAVAAVPGALVFQRFTGYYVWDTRSGHVTRHLGNGQSHVAPAFGETLPWCTHCDRALELTNLESGKTKPVPLSIHSDTDDALASAHWSPDGTRLAIPEYVDPGRTADVILVDVAAGRATRFETTGQNVSVAWSSDSRRLYIAASNTHETHITIRDLTAGTSRDLGTVPVPTLHLAAVISKEQAAHLLGAPRVASPSQCVVPVPIRKAQSDCSYRYS